MEANNQRLDELEFRHLSTSSRRSPSPDKEDQVAKRKTLLERIPGLGLILVLLSSLCYSLSALMVKLLPTLQPLYILFGRSLMQVTIFLPVVVYSESTPFGYKSERLMLSARIFFGCIYVTSQFYAIRLLPLADAFTIVSSSPAFVTVFACLILKEPCGVFNIFTVFLVLLGVAFIGKPTFIFGGTASETQLVGTLVALTSTVAMSLVLICLRRLKKTPSSVIILSFSFVLVIECLLGLAILGEISLPNCGVETVLYLACGAFSALGQYLITAATKLEKAGPTSVAKTSGILFAFLLQISVLGKDPPWTSILGAILICFTVLMLAVRRWYKERPESFSWLIQRFR